MYVITGESLGSEALIYAVFEFINLLVELPKFHPVIKENIKQLIYYITIYTQMTTEQVRSNMFIWELWPSVINGVPQLPQ